MTKHRLLAAWLWAQATQSQAQQGVDRERGFARGSAVAGGRQVTWRVSVAWPLSIRAWMLSTVAGDRYCSPHCGQTSAVDVGDDVDLLANGLGIGNGFGVSAARHRLSMGLLAS